MSNIFASIPDTYSNNHVLLTKYFKKIIKISATIRIDIQEKVNFFLQKMSVVFLDGPTVTEFVNDSGAFSQFVNEHFNKLDADGDGVLSRDELQKRVGKLSSREYELQSQEEIENLYDALFEKFDVDRNATIDRDEFKSLMKEIMVAKARGLGNSPVSIIVQDDSLLMRAVKHKESAVYDNQK